MSRNDMIMQVKKVEITTKSDNREIEVLKTSKTMVHEHPPKTPKEQSQPNVKPKQEPIEPNSKPREQPSEQLRELHGQPKLSPQTEKI
eukprot:15279908-Ditylum_brightwellii.AAC.1